MKLSKKTIILSVLVTLFPIVIGLILWNRLPDRIATHFGFNNVANGWSSKAFTVFGMPAILAGIQLLCLWATTNDPRRKNINGKLFTVVIWTIPVISLICCLSIYAIAMQVPVNIGLLVNLIIGILFLLIGNYLPKIRQNYTVGIKLPWTLNSEENWNRTHRMSGWLWMVGGLAMIANAFLQSGIVLAVVICGITLPPAIYSYLLFKKGI